MLDSDSDDELPPGWEERATVDGNIYYVDHTFEKTQWIHPRTGKKKCVSKEFPFGWSKCVDPEGSVLFRHENADVSTHTDPRLAFATEYDPSTRETTRCKFDGSSSADDVLHGLDLSDKVAIVTGANSGIGFETAYSLAMHDCRVVLACRNETAAAEAVANVLLKRKNAKCSFIKLDLCSLASVERFVDEFRNEYDRVDILILNAGVFGAPYSQTEDGYETTFQVCHLAHFYLTKLLEPLLLNSLAARIVVLSSESHRFSELTKSNVTEDIISPCADHYSSWAAYNNAKLCNILFARELHSRWYVRGVNVYAVHPGNVVYTNIHRYSFFYKIIFFICRLFTKSLSQAASTGVFCATSPTLKRVSGVYFNNCFPCEPSESARDPRLAQALWYLSEKLIANALEKRAPSLSLL